MIKRFFDFTVSLIAMIILSPLYLFLAIFVKLDSKGPVIYKQKRIGKDGKEFILYKFRTMYVGADRKGKITVGHRDPRVTRVGYYLRKYKLDELPQLFNILRGDMSFVGPRPEVEKYVKLYDEQQRKVLSVRPGLTDYASLEYVDESEILAKSDNPEQTYIEEVMPAKLALNLKYIEERNFLVDLKLILKTIFKVFSGR